MTLPIPANVFADGELTNEASWYARIFSAINSMYTTLSALPLVQHGNFTITWSATTIATGTVTFPTGFAGAPDVVVGCASFSTTPVIINTSGVTATNFSYRASFISGTATGTTTGYYVATRG